MSRRCLLLCSGRARANSLLLNFRPPLAPATFTLFHADGSVLTRLVPRVGYAAQHDSLATSVVKVCAVSLMPSAIVRYGAHVSARSLIVSPNLTA